MTFDLAVALSLLAASGAIPADALDDTVVLGELGLDGTVRPIRGVLPAVIAAVRCGTRQVVVPAENAVEARLVPGISIKGTDSLARLLRFVRGCGPLLEPPEPVAEQYQTTWDFADVLGQDRGKRAVALAAAGGHHLALFGPPGAGKTMLAQRLPGVLPPLDDAAAQEVTAVHSIAGALPAGSPLLRRPPFQAPHHTATAAALVGGGGGLAKPGALSLAHLGVLFLDEAPEFRSSVLNALRQPLEDGEVRLRRSGGETVYPARAQLVVAANPCPCASAGGDQHCQCSRLTRRRYLGRLSGPMMDRIDLQVTLQPVRAAALLGGRPAGDSSEAVARQVRRARAAAAARWATTGGHLQLEGRSVERATIISNAAVPGPALRSATHRLSRQTLRAAARAVDLGRLSARGFDRVVRVSWSIADLDGRDRPDAGDIAEALDLRSGICA